MTFIIFYKHKLLQKLSYTKNIYVRMITFPNIKINLGLRITEKRSDGYHNIESCFYPVKWQDSLEVIESDMLKMDMSGIAIPGDVTTNLCMKAYNLLKEKYNLPPIHIHLHKNIPTGTGLGAGSGDGAFMLKLLNDFFELHLKEPELERLALQLGSDCPFFIKNKPLFARGRGEIIKTTHEFLKGKYIQIICPGIHISTAEAFSSIQPKIPERKIEEIISSSTESWKENLINDFEYGAIKKYPLIGEIKKQLYNNGAIYASMSGSGSSIVGIFEQQISPLNFDNADMNVWTGKL